MTLPLLCTRADIITALSADRQAQATNDPLRRAQLGNADGIARRFLTPWAEATTLTVYLAGVKQDAGWSLSSATGTDGRDEVVFASAPASGMVSATADNRAINVLVVDGACADATAFVLRYIPPGTDLSDAGLLAQLKPIAVRQVKLVFRGRRDQDVPDALDLVVKADVRWLESARDGKAQLPVAGTASSPNEVRVYAEKEAFGPLPGNADPESFWP